VTANAETRQTAIAVTGASGFIGRQLIARLVADGTAVVALSRRGIGQRDMRECIVRDYADIATLAATLQGVDVLIHLAARAHLGSAGPEDEALFQAANVDTTRAVAQACVEAGVRRMVFVSSIGVLGNHTHGRPWTDADTPNPVETYAKSKLAAEESVAAVLGVGSTDFVILRPSLVYGPGCPGNFRTLVKLAARLPLVPLGALVAPRSFVYVANLVDALLVAARHPAASRRTFIVCDNRDVSVAEVVRTVGAALGRSPRAVVNVPPRLLSIVACLTGKYATYEKLSAELRADASGFREATGWSPPFDPTQGLVATAREWHSANDRT